MRSDCRPSQMLTRATAAVLLLLALVVGGATARADTTSQHGEAARATAKPDASHEAPGGAQHSEGEQEHEAGWFPTIAKTFNFAVLVGVLVYFLRAPLAAYLSSRIAQVREDLVTAAATRETALRQLAEIEARLQALPAELEALKRRGAEEIAAERVRIEQVAETERRRLLEHTRREIEMRLRVARRELVEFAATLAVTVASERIRRSMTPDDQTRLVDRYTSQLEGAQQ